MLEERAHQLPILANVGKLLGDTLVKLLPRLQGATRVARALGMTPYQFVGIQVGSIAGQYVKDSRPCVEAT